ncbi:MAG: SusD/RagB family nutrient-binding outer membrane lipoprotein [Chitinophagaceae bacterium]
MKLIIKYIVFVLVIGGLASCKKYLDVNKNPNAATKPPINGLLIRTTQNTALNVFRVADITSYYVQYLANTSLAGATDTYEPIDASGTWSLLYNNMTDIYDLQKFGEDQGAAKYQGVAKIMMAMNLQLVHNLWGAAPYSNAFTGEVLTPAYDDAQTIFQACITLLDEGISLLNKTDPTIDLAADADLIHHGVAAAWVKTAHALKARLLNQLSKTQQYNTTAIFAELAAAYTSAADDAYITTFDVRNPWNQEAVDNAALLLDGWLSKNYVDAMTGTTYGIFDPRLPLTASLTKFGDYRGTRNGGDRVGNGTSKEESYISLTGYYSSTSSPLYIITYEEMKFIEAEAAIRSNDLPRAYAAYIAGITANMNKMGVTAAARDTYINDPSVSVGAANITLPLIFKEKYKALFLMPVTWDDARRFDYGYQGFQLPLNVVTNTFIRRLVYPTVETSRNSVNVPAVADVTQKLWWDQ